MKRFFLLLLVANAILFGWWQMKETPQPAAPAAMKAESGKPLRLLSEVAESERPARKSSAIPSVAEAPVSPPEQAEPVVARTPADGNEDGGPVNCYRVEGFEDRQAALAGREALRRLGAEVGEPVEISESLTRYWVLLPPFSTRRAAERVIARLNGAGLKDHYLIAQGEYKQGISLGLFSSKAAARRRLEAAAALKLRGQIKETTLSSRRYRLVVAWPGGGIREWKERLPGAKIAEIECPR